MSEDSAKLAADPAVQVPRGAVVPVTVNTPRPRAPLVAILGVFALFAAFALLVYYVYLPRRTNQFPDDGIRTAEQRLKTLAELRAKEAQQLTSYAWIDKQAGTVQLPLDRAMQLTLEQYQKKSR